MVSLISWCVSVCACVCGYVPMHVRVCVSSVQRKCFISITHYFFPTNKFVLYEELKPGPCIWEKNTIVELYAGCEVLCCFTSKTGSTALNLAWAAQ